LKGISMADIGTAIDCRSIVEIVTGYFEGALDPAAMRVVGQHLRSCEGCRRYLDQMRATIAAIARLRDEDAPPEPRERLLVALRDLGRVSFGARESAGA
jgi:predicted anti-sigma-YlaC factor YlaD